MRVALCVIGMTMLGCSDAKEAETPLESIRISTPAAGQGGLYRIRDDETGYWVYVTYHGLTAVPILKNK